MPTKSNNTGGRGGARPGVGRKKSAVKEKAEKGNPGGRKLEVLDIPEVEGVDMPKPHDFLSAEQRDGSKLQAEDIYTETWEWLKKIGCASKVSPQLLERYAMCSDTVRGNDKPHGISLQAPDNAEAYPFAVYQYRHQLYESGCTALERDFSDRQRELQHGIRRGHSAGRPHGKIAQSKERIIYV